MSLLGIVALVTRGRNAGVRRPAVIALAAAAACALAMPAAAWAHAALLRTSPVASRTVNKPPPDVRLTYSEPIEARFAIVSVTNAEGRQVTSGAPRSAAGQPQTLVTPLERVPEGWYLVFWRVISADGHPVRGAFTFAVGPNPGPPPQFRVPSLSETATTTQLLIARWVVFLSLMSAIGLFVLRTLIARPVTRRVRGVSLNALSVGVRGGAGRRARRDADLRRDRDRAVLASLGLRPRRDRPGRPRVRASGATSSTSSSCSRCSAVAAAISLLVDRPDRPQRSVAELLALGSALATAAAALVLPGLAGHAGQKSPRGVALPLDTLHLAAGSVWLGGLIGLVVFWFAVGRERRVAALGVVVPRFSNVAFVSVLALIGSGIGQSLLELPTLASLWQTSYGKALLWKIGLLTAALVLASVNLARTKPRLEAGRVERRARSSAVRLRRDRPRRRRALRGCRADEPAAALERARQREEHLGPRRTRARSRPSSPKAPIAST